MSSTNHPQFLIDLEIQDLHTAEGREGEARNLAEDGAIVGGNNIAIGPIMEPTGEALQI